MSKRTISAFPDEVRSSKSVLGKASAGGRQGERADRLVQPAPAATRTEARPSRSMSPTRAAKKTPIDAVSTTASVSDLAALAKKIRKAHALAQGSFRASLEHAVKVGRLLQRAKKLVPHGKFGKWLTEKCPGISARTARAYMQVAADEDLLNAAEDDKAKRQPAAVFTLKSYLKARAKPRADRAEDGTTSGSANAPETAARDSDDGDPACDHDHDHGDGIGRTQEDEAEPSGARERATTTSYSLGEPTHGPEGSTTELTTPSTRDRCATSSAEACASSRTASTDEPDDETAWLTSLPLRQRLADPAIFDKEVLGWRKAQPVVKALRDVCAALGLTGEDYARARLGPSCRQRYSRHLACVVGVKPPGEWTVCRECRGTGKGKSRTECNLCAGGGFVITHAGDVVFDEEEK